MQTQKHPRALLGHQWRSTFLPYLFGRDYLNGELNVYAYARQYLPGYDGGEWHFYTLHVGGGYMAPAGEGRCKVCNSDNGYVGEMSADAAGIFVTAMVLNHRCFMWHRRDEEELSQHLSQRFDELRRYIDCHPERLAILSALD